MQTTIIKGEGKDKSLLLLSGLHGNEYTPLFVLNLLRSGNFLNKILKYYEIITIVECFNDYGIRNNIRGFKANDDFNRIFNKDSNVEILKKLIADHTHIIDIHSSPNCSEMVLINQNNQANSYVEFCLKHNIKYTLWEEGSRFSIKQHVIDQDRIAFTVECNGLSLVDNKSVNKTLILMKRLLKNLHKLKVEDSTPKFLAAYNVCASADGVFTHIKNTGYILDITTAEMSKLKLVKHKDDEPRSIAIGYVKFGDIVAITQPPNYL